MAISLASRVALVLSLCAAAHAEIAMSTVPIGNAGNVGELSGAGAGGYGLNRVCGSVAEPFRMGTYEVTTGQYTAFLNAVAASDPYALYNTQMWTSSRGCRIERQGSAGSYTYAVAPDWADRPVNYVSWADAARFANWMHNGQPIGAQGLGTTEDGAYYLNGATTRPALIGVGRSPDAAWFIPSEDEWYKAAYHKNDGPTGNYWDYATSSNIPPANVLLNPDPGNNANYYDGDSTIGAPYWRTPVGAFANSRSAYGTYDQGGNVFEWMESKYAPDGDARTLRGGSATGNGIEQLFAGARDLSDPTAHFNDVGFRVASVPEPSTAAAAGALAATFALMRRRPE